MAVSAGGMTDRVAAIGRMIDPESIAASERLYLADHEAEPYPGVRVVRDVRYGPHARHRLDVFAAEAADAAPRPVLLFVHGGGFFGGDKKTEGSPYNDNVALWAARAGMVGVNMTYRLAPECQWPAGAEDVAAAVAWVRGHIAGHGGDPARIFLMGTSAGAVHAASYAALPGFGEPARDLAGLILLSGLYDIEIADRNDMLAAYFGDDPGLYRARSSLPGLVDAPFPVMVTLAEFEPRDLERQALRLVTAHFDRHGRWPHFIRLMGHNHLTTTLHLNTADTYLGDRIRDFTARASRLSWRSAGG